MSEAEELAIGRLCDEVRKLRYEKKHLEETVKWERRDKGKLGDQVYQLRCEVDHYRRMLTVDPGHYRTMLARLHETEHELDRAEMENRDLKKRLGESGE